MLLPRPYRRGDMKGSDGMIRRILILMAVLMLALPCTAQAEWYRAIKEAENELNAADDLDKKWINILLIGSDTRSDKKDAERSDTMMICSVNLDAGEIKLTSLERDMWVEIPGRSGHHKLNAAHSYGGPELLMKTINTLFHMNVTHYVSVNFYDFCGIVDLLGGVTVPLTAAEISVINSTVSASDYGDTDYTPIPKGASEAHLNGAQALAYVRIRKIDDDFGRTARQRTLLSALLHGVIGRPVMDLVALYDDAYSRLSTNYSPGDLLAIAQTVAGHAMGDMPQLSLPTPEHFHYDESNGVSKVVYDSEATVRQLHEFIYGGAEEE